MRLRIVTRTDVEARNARTQRETENYFFFGISHAHENRRNKEITKGMFGDKRAQTQAHTHAYLTAFQ